MRRASTSPVGPLRSGTTRASLKNLARATTVRPKSSGRMFGFAYSATFTFVRSS